MTVPKNLNQCFIKGMQMSFLVLFKRPEHVEPFVDHMNSKYKNINFSFEAEKDGQMTYLMSTCFMRMVSL